MARLREAIHLRSYANINPLQDYVNEGYSLFRECLELASVDAVLNLVNIRITPVEQPAEEEKSE
jgi:preprotein translocase subunit SecA